MINIYKDDNLDTSLKYIPVSQGELVDLEQIDSLMRNLQIVNKTFIDSYYKGDIILSNNITKNDIQFSIIENKTIPKMIMKINTDIDFIKYYTYITNFKNDMVQLPYLFNSLYFGILMKEIEIYTDGKTQLSYNNDLQFLTLKTGKTKTFYEFINPKIQTQITKKKIVLKIPIIIDMTNKVGYIYDSNYNQIGYQYFSNKLKIDNSNVNMLKQNSSNILPIQKYFKKMEINLFNINLSYIEPELEGFIFLPLISMTFPVNKTYQEEYFNIIKTQINKTKENLLYNEIIISDWTLEDLMLDRIMKKDFQNLLSQEYLEKLNRLKIIYNKIIEDDLLTSVNNSPLLNDNLKDKINKKQKEIKNDIWSQPILNSTYKLPLLEDIFIFSLIDRLINDEDFDFNEFSDTILEYKEYFKTSILNNSIQHINENNIFEFLDYQFSLSNEEDIQSYYLSNIDNLKTNYDKKYNPLDNLNELFDPFYLKINEIFDLISDDDILTYLNDSDKEDIIDDLSLFLPQNLQNNLLNENNKKLKTTVSNDINSIQLLTQIQIVNVYTEMEQFYDKVETYYKNNIEKESLITQELEKYLDNIIEDLFNKQTNEITTGMDVLKQQYLETKEPDEQDYSEWFDNFKDDLVDTSIQLKNSLKNSIRKPENINKTKLLNEKLKNTREDLNDFVEPLKEMGEEYQNLIDFMLNLLDSTNETVNYIDELLDDVQNNLTDLVEQLDETSTQLQQVLPMQDTIDNVKNELLNVTPNDLYILDKIDNILKNNSFNKLLDSMGFYSQIFINFSKEFQFQSELPNKNKIFSLSDSYILKLNQLLENQKKQFNQNTDIEKIKNSFILDLKQINNDIINTLIPSLQQGEEETLKPDLNYLTDLSQIVKILNSQIIIDLERFINLLPDYELQYNQLFTYLDVKNTTFDKFKLDLNKYLKQIFDLTIEFKNTENYTILVEINDYILKIKTDILDVLQKTLDNQIKIIRKNDYKNKVLEHQMELQTNTLNIINTTFIRNVNQQLDIYKIIQDYDNSFSYKELVLKQLQKQLDNIQKINQDLEQNSLPLLYEIGKQKNNLNVNKIKESSLEKSTKDLLNNKKEELSDFVDEFFQNLLTKDDLDDLKDFIKDVIDNQDTNKLLQIGNKINSLLTGLPQQQNENETNQQTNGQQVNGQQTNGQQNNGQQTNGQQNNINTSELDDTSSNDTFNKSPLWSSTGIDTSQQKQYSELMNLQGNENTETDSSIMQNNIQDKVSPSVLQLQVYYITQSLKDIIILLSQLDNVKKYPEIQQLRQKQLKLDDFVKDNMINVYYDKGKDLQNQNDIFEEKQISDIVLVDIFFNTSVNKLKQIDLDWYINEFIYKVDLNIDRKPLLQRNTVDLTFGIKRKEIYPFTTVIYDELTKQFKTIYINQKDIKLVDISSFDIKINSYTNSISGCSKKLLRKDSFKEMLINYLLGKEDIPIPKEVINEMVVNMSDDYCKLMKNISNDDTDNVPPLDISEQYIVQDKIVEELLNDYFKDVNGDIFINTNTEILQMEITKRIVTQLEVQIDIQSQVDDEDVGFLDESGKREVFINIPNIDKLIRRILKQWQSTVSKQDKLMKSQNLNGCG